MVEAFLWEAVRFGFQHAGVTGIDEDWQPITNPGPSDQYPGVAAPDYPGTQVVRHPFFPH